MKIKLEHVTIIILILIYGLNVPVLAANECKIQYGWNTGSSLQRTFKNHTAYLYLNKGQSKNINKSRMNFVKNINNSKVRVYLTGVTLSPITLDKNQRNPVAGTYLGTPKLVKTQCLNTSASSGSSTASGLASVLKASGKSASYIAGQLKTRFNQNISQIAQLLKGIGFSAVETAKALRVGVNASAGQVGSALVGIWVNNNLDTIGILVPAKFSTDEIIRFSLRLGGLTVEKTAGALKKAGVSATQYVAGFVKAGIRMIPIVQTLKKLGYTPQQVMGIVIFSFNNKEQAIANAFKQVGYTAEQTTVGLKAVFRFTRGRAEQVLKNARFSAAQIAVALNRSFGVIIENQR